MDFVYFGDGLWATLCLERLLQDGHRALAIVERTAPSDSTLREFAEQSDITVRRPQRVNDPDFVAWIQSLEPRLNISMSYDQILRKAIIESAPLGFINCHAGKLPYYRGRNVINWAIINNEPEVGLTIHYMDEGIDTGDIILQRVLPIEWEDTYETVLEKVRGAFPGLLSEAVGAIANNQVCRRKQAHLAGTYFPGRIPGDEWIDWSETSLNIYNKIRAITRPGPGARTRVQNRILTIWRAIYNPNWPKYLATPGTVVGVLREKGVQIKTGDSTIVLERVQFEDEPEQVPRFPNGTRLGVNVYHALEHLRSELEELRKICGRTTEKP